MEKDQNQSLPPTCPPSVQEARPAAPTLVRYFGDYELMDEIARGGMGIVYRARQLSLNRPVAVKMILAGQLATEDDVRRFRTEAEAAANLDHPGIVPIYEIGQHEGQHFYSMAYVPGRSLAGRIAEGPLPPREAAELVKTVAEAVEHAHQQGVIHRDLKPANVLLDSAGRPRVTDFGLAKRAASGADLTATGQVLGTPSYMPPEQAAGKLDQIGPTTDVYSLGAILYNLLTGRPPFQAASPVETLRQVIDHEPVAPRRLNPVTPRDLETVCLKCLRKQPGDRYSSAGELAEELGRFLAGEPIRARRLNPAIRLARYAWRRQRTLVAVAGTLLLISAAVSSAWLFDWWRQGFVQPRSNGGLLTAEFTRAGSSSPAAVVPVDRTTSAPAPLSAGEYDVKLSAPGFLDEHYRLLVQRRHTHQLQVGMGRGYLWPPIRGRSGEQFSIVNLSDRPALFLWAGERARLLDAATATTLWDVAPDLGAPNRPAWDVPVVLVVSGRDTDLDGDRVGDLICWASHAGEGTPLWVLSGSNGKLLWKLPHATFRREGVFRVPDQRTATVRAPLVMHADSDGVPDVVAQLITIRDQGGPQSRMNVAAFSGKDGREIWRYPLGEQVRTVSTAPLTRATIHNRDAVIAVAGARLIGLAADSGKELWPPFDLGVREPSPPIAADLNSDGDSEFLVAASRDQVLLAVSPQAAAVLWKKLFYRQDAIGVRVADLELDGNPEVVVADFRYLYVLDGKTGSERWESSDSRGISTVGFELLPDTNQDGCSDLLLLNASSWSFSEGAAVELLLLSGKDGSGLHKSNLLRAPSDLVKRDVSSIEGFDLEIIPGQSAAGGWPKLYLRPKLNHLFETREKFISVFDAQGHVELQSESMAGPQLGDLDSDGIVDLIGAKDGVLIARPLSGRELWRRLGRFQPIQDLTADGWDDAIPESGPVYAVSGKDGSLLWKSSLAARQISAGTLPFGDLNGDRAPDVFAVDHGVGSLTIRSFSGADGRRLWSVTLDWLGSDPSSERFTFGRDVVYCCPDVNGDQCPDVWFATHIKLPNGDSPQIEGVPPGTEPCQVGILSGRNGRLLWSQNWPAQRSGHLSTPLFADLSGDGNADVFAPLPEEDYAEPESDQLLALRGDNGTVLWRKPGHKSHSSAWDLGWNWTFQFTADHPKVPWRVGDLDGDGRAEVIAHDDATAALVAFDGASGQARWTFPVPRLQGFQLANLDGGNRRCVWVLANNEHFVLDHGGRLRHGQPQQKWDVGGDFIQAHDLDADGKDELLINIWSGLQATRAGDERPIWQWEVPLPPAGPDGKASRNLHGVELWSGSPNVLVVTASLNAHARNALFGLDAASGRLLWTARLASSESSADIRMRAMRCPVANSPAAYLMTEGDVTVCRLAQ